MSRRTVLITVMLLSLAIAAVAQQNAELTVRVQERNGVVPRAVVVLSAVDGDAAYRRLTNDEGIAGFPEIPPGSYRLTVTFIGFQEHNEVIDLPAGKTEKTVTLKMAQFSQTVTITTANRREELLRSVAEPTTVLSEADIRDTGGRTAKNVLQDQVGAGVFVEEGGGQGHVSINGIGNSGILVLIDGRRWLGKNGVGDLDLEDLDMSKFERVEVIKGAGSAMYGSEAIGGVINFITKKRDYSGITNNVDFTYGSYNDIRVADTLTYLEGPFNGTLSAGYRSFDGYDLNEEDPQTQGLPESKYYTFAGTGEYRLNDMITVSGLLDFNRRDVDKYYFAGATQLAEDVYNSVRQIDRITISPEADIALSDLTLVNLRYTYSKYQRDETRIYPDRTDVLDPWQEWNSEFNGTISQGYNLFDQDHILQAGYEYRNEKMDRNNLVFPDTGESEVDRDINVFWAQNEFNLTDQIKLTAGFRYDDYSDFGDEFSPKVGIMFAVTPEHRLRFSYGHGFRAPSFGELYIDLGFFFKGNPDLQPEISDNFTFGYTFTGDYASGSIDYFYNDVENLIAFDLSVFPFTYNNLNAITARGINSEISVSLPGGFTPTVSYTYVDREDDEGDEVPGFAKHNGFFKLLYANPRYGLRANIRAQFNDEIVYRSGESRPSYTMWSGQVSKDLFALDNYDVSAFIQIDNITDEVDIVTRDASGNPLPGELAVWLPGRTYLFGITINMDFVE